MDITEKYKNLNHAQGTCYINKLEKKTMVHEINTLAKALIKNEKKYLKMQDAFKKKVREYRRTIRDKDASITRMDSEIKSFSELTKQLKSNSEHLMHDLVKQQKIAKDSLRALESLGDKYDREKRELMARLEKEKEELLKREEHKFETKVNSLKAINEQISKKLVTLDKTQEEFQDLQKNYGEAV
jgi:chromosome segregation ATPase